MIGNLTGIGKTTSGSSKGLYILMLFYSPGSGYAYTLVNKPIANITELRNYVEENGNTLPYGGSSKYYPCLGGSNKNNTVEMFVNSSRQLKVNVYKSDDTTIEGTLTYYGIIQLM